MTIMEIADSGSWSIGVLVGAPIAALLIIACLVIIIAGIVIWRSDGWILVTGGGVGLTLVLAVALSPLGFYPYSGEYHQWREASGTVAKIDKRLISKGKSMEDKFVVSFDGGGQQFGCDDTRCAGVEVGDQLTLSCKRAWQYTGTDGYDCRFVSTEAAR